MQEPGSSGTNNMNAQDIENLLSRVLETIDIYERKTDLYFYLIALNKKYVSVLFHIFTLNFVNMQ